jgi:hypothetical protein
VGKESGVREENEAYAARREDVLPAAPQRQNTEKTSRLITPQTPTTKKYTTAYLCSLNRTTFSAFRIPHRLASIGRGLWLRTSRRNENKTTLYASSARSPGPLRYSCVVGTSSGRTTAVRRGAPRRAWGGRGGRTG